MRIAIRPSLNEIPAEQWDALDSSGNPFLRHAFLATLENTGCASAESGWYPCHVTCEDDTGALLGAMPLYLKTNPYGEFVFDYAWAGAYQQAGLPYYPKLVSAVPFTPATGPRFLVRPGAARAEISAALLQGAMACADSNDASSLHILFPDADSRAAARAGGLLTRKDCQFHWHNDGYRDFDDFLEGFTAAKRKKTRRERRRVSEAGIEFRTLSGADLDAAAWDEIMPLYASTFLRRGREPYLGRDFFVEITRRLPEHVIVFAGFRGQTMVGVAICFRSDSHLYGRYWGAAGFYDSLHFEACYYQGIDYCIAEGLQVFEPGTQGEHKIARGFVPTETWSAHWLSHPQFAAAVDDYLRRERAHIDRYIDVLGEHVPYKSTEG